MARAAPARSRPRQRGFCVSAGTTFRAATSSDCGDGQVDVEDRPPVGELGEDAADEDADRRARSADRAPGGERLRALRAVEGGGDDRERRRGEDRGAEPLARAGGEEHRRASGHRRGERGSGEDAEAGQEHAAAAEEVGGAAAEEQEASEDQRVARDRPADLRAAQLQVGRDVRQRDVHGGDVEDDHQLRDEQHRQKPAMRRAAASVPSTAPCCRAVVLECFGLWCMT